MLHKLKKREEGFTIIEVLIVLAIAGLIMLIVFLAVPALQRNSRNTQRRNDVGGILSAMNEYVNNNGGTLPATSDKSWLDNAKLGYYDKTKVTYTDSKTAPGTAEDVVVIKGYNCGSTPTADPAPASPRSYVAWYKVETSGDTTNQCQSQ
jgi:prepilin-type N-terminal cleavage/methylation domain-containing protein